MLLTDLKIEGNTVLLMNAETNEWEPFPASMIESLERLVREIDRFSFPDKTNRSPVYFETKYNLGQASVSSVKDEDGDITYTVLRPNHFSVSFDEDAAFENEAKKTFGDDRLEGVDKEINHWATSIAKKVDERRRPSTKHKITQTKNANNQNAKGTRGKKKHDDTNEVTKAVKSLLINDSNKRRKNSVAIAENVPEYYPAEVSNSSKTRNVVKRFYIKSQSTDSSLTCKTFERKRRERSQLRVSNKKVRDLRKAMKISFLNRTINPHPNRAGKKAYLSVSYMAKNKRFLKSSTDGIASVSRCRFINKHGMPDTFESYFFLKDFTPRPEREDDESFENLLNKIIE